jgi:Gas vesicle synthesis protein GvpL/GvpF
METAIKEGIYIYCIIGSSQAQSFGAIGIGERGDELYCVNAEGLCAVVSHSPIQKFKMSRDNLLAHERAIEEVMKTHTVLPVRFATVAETEEKVQNILRKEAERFTSLLREIAGRKELGLKAIFNSEQIYAQIAEQEEIKRLKARLTSMPADKIYLQKMELGRMVEQALERERDQRRADILSELTPLVIEVKTTKPYGEMMILNAACFIAGEREAEFDRAVHALAERFGELITWRYTGTLPPFNFVNVIINAADL